MSALLTIVIANYNYGRFLETAIGSIIRDAYDNTNGRLTVLGQSVELIICDAASTDNSVEIIEKYANGLPQKTGLEDWLTLNHQTIKPSEAYPITWWCSEKDCGQSAAFNKGFLHGTGKYLTWLNADDLYVPGGLIAAVRQMIAHPDCDWFTGNTVGFRDRGEIIHAAFGPHWFPAFMQWKNSPIVVPGPTSFFSRRIYEQVGKIDESLHFTMDTHLWIKFIVAGIKQRRILSLVWAFRYHDASKTCEYEGHHLDAIKRQRMRDEFTKAMVGIHYNPSRCVHVFYLVCRLFDGSLLRRNYYRKFKKHINGVN